MNSDLSDPFELLTHIEQVIRKTAQKLPRTEHVARWVGIGFELMGISMVVPLTAVEEVLHYPKLTPVPHAKRWLKGLTNLRGAVLPVTDVATLLTGQLTNISQSGKILVIRQQEEYFGLLVARVVGLKRFDISPVVKQDYSVPKVLMPFIQGVFTSEAGDWYLLDLTRVVQLEAFYETSNELICAV